MYYEQLVRIIESAENVVFFGGAGVSTGSGIPDFRGNNGLYKEEGEEGSVSAEEILHVNYMRRYPEKFYEYYKKKMVYEYAEPNDAHYALADMERAGKLKAVITQNIDGLHQSAGSENVFELHGSVHRNYCEICGEKYPLSAITGAESVPICKKCGGAIRPDVVMYGEALPSDAWYGAEEAISEADVLIVGGTSLTVQPASYLINAYEGEHLIIINLSPTPYDGLAEMVIREPVEEVLSYVASELDVN